MLLHAKARTLPPCGTKTRSSVASSGTNPRPRSAGSTCSLRSPLTRSEASAVLVVVVEEEKEEEEEEASAEEEEEEEGGAPVAAAWTHVPSHQAP